MDNQNTGGQLVAHVDSGLVTYDQLRDYRTPESTRKTERCESCGLATPAPESCVSARLTTSTSMTRLDMKRRSDKPAFIITEEDEYVVRNVIVSYNTAPTTNGKVTIALTTAIGGRLSEV